MSATQIGENICQRKKNANRRITAKPKKGRSRRAKKLERVVAGRAVGFAAQTPSVPAIAATIGATLTGVFGAPIAAAVVGLLNGIFGEAKAGLGNTKVAKKAYGASKKGISQAMALKMYEEAIKPPKAPIGPKPKGSKR